MRQLPDPSLNWPVALDAVRLIANAEGLRLKSYRCPAGKWTIGWGETAGIVAGMVWTKQQADERFCAALTEYAAQVRGLCKEYANDNELGALVSLGYNIGLGALAKSSVMRAHNSGDKQAAARAFGLWNKARVNGTLTVLNGLVARRAAEAALYLTPEDDEPQSSMPQAIEPETSLVKSPISQSGVAVVATGAVTTASSISDQVKGIGSDIASVASNFGVEPSTLLGIILLAAGATVVYWRKKQRDGGWS